MAGWLGKDPEGQGQGCDVSTFCGLGQRGSGIKATGKDSPQPWISELSKGIASALGPVNSLSLEVSRQRLLDFRM